MEHTSSSDEFIREWEDEQERQKKAREKAEQAKKLAEKEPIKKNTHTTPQPSTLYPLSTTQPPPQRQRQRIQVAPLSTSEIQRVIPKEKPRAPVSIYGPQMPHIPIPKRGKVL